MNTKLYTGTGSNQSITGIGFQPDFLWGKNREKNTTYTDHVLVDAIRGSTKRIYSNKVDAESTGLTGVISFDTDGYTVGTGTNLNNNTDDILGWCWKANGTGSANTDGSISSTVSANTTAGFSIVKYTGTGSVATIGHGLGGKIPKMIIIKNTSSSSPAYAWRVYNAGLTIGQSLQLQASNAQEAGYWNNTAPTTTVFSVGANGETNQSSGTNIAYCFADVTGYSKFSTYIGNGNVDGTFVPLSFAPTFVMVKKASGAGSWWIHDNKTSPFNVATNVIVGNSDASETTGVAQMDFLSNGFKLRDTTDASNSSGGTYIYMAFGQSIVGTNNVPNNAR